MEQIRTAVQVAARTIDWSSLERIRLNLVPVFFDFTSWLQHFFLS